MQALDLAGYMEGCRELVLNELRRIVPADTKYGPILYDLIFEYPLREAKALRPALCIATCRALGGNLEGVATSATVLELYHNAFLIHDDIEDGSELRRDGPTLHRRHGVPAAINVGDAMLALALEPLLDNMRVLTLGKALRILSTVSDMARESAEGQAIELSWIRSGAFMAGDREYLRMAHKKTGRYTFLAPVVVGGIVGEGSSEQIARLRLFATALGVAFQIQDDILNLSGTRTAIGKEQAGDLWEGKHTLVLLHAVRNANKRERSRALGILRKPRPSPALRGRTVHARQLLGRLAARGEVRPDAHHALRHALARIEHGSRVKTRDDVAFLLDLIDRHGSIPHARSVARRFALRARKSLRQMAFLRPSVHRDFLEALTEFVVERDH